jgi:hypothetical protein
MNGLGHKWIVITNSRIFMILTLVFLVVFPIGFSVYTITGESQTLNNLSIEILTIEVDTGSTPNRINITLRISNPTKYTTPFTMDAFIRPITFSLNRFVAENKLSEIVIDSDNSKLQTLTINIEPELVEVTMKGITMKTLLPSKLFFNLIPFSKTGMSYYQPEEEKE